MIGLSRLKADVAKLVAPRSDGPTVIQLTLRHQRHFLDSEGRIPFDYWEPLDSGEAGSARREVFELCCQFPETRIWQVADKRGLRGA